MNYWYRHRYQNKYRPIPDTRYRYRSNPTTMIRTRRLSQTARSATQELLLWACEG